MVAVLVLLVVALGAVGFVLSNRVIVPAPYGLMPEFEVLATEATPAAAPGRRRPAAAVGAGHR